jgi:quinol-cytochrome oxidoreductase complex cytochrome b subunit
VFGGMWETVRSWVRQTWGDLKDSIDPNLLSSVRFLGLLYGRIDRELPVDESLRKSLRYRLAPHVGWRHALGSITYLLFIILVVTGVLLAFYYRPSAQEAYPSMQYVVSEVPFGWLVRNVHMWAANLIVILVLAHMARVFFEAAYKPPRETNWVVGLLLLFVVLAFGATGYLLPWDQWSYWTVTEVLNALSGVPVLSWFVGIVAGDEIVSGATLSRFFALHVIVLPWVAFALIVFHFTMVRRHGIAPPKSGVMPTGEGLPFFPHHLLRAFMVGVLVLAVTISLAALFPRPVGQAADPYQLPGQLVSTWVPVDVSLALVRYGGALGFVLFSAMGVSLALVPLFDRRPERRLAKRPVVAALGIAFFVGFVLAFAVGRWLGSLPPSEHLGQDRIEERVVPAGPQTPLPSPGLDERWPGQRPRPESGGGR